MREEDLTPYVGQHVTLHLDEDQLPEMQRGTPTSGVLSFETTLGDPPERIAVLRRRGQVITVSLYLIIGVTSGQG